MILRKIILILTIAAGVRRCHGSCDDFFKKRNPKHLLCLVPNKECSTIESDISAGDIALILRKHNVIRSIIALNRHKGLPQAANMMKLSWDDELASIAQKEASICKRSGYSADARFSSKYKDVGQNMAIKSYANGDEGSGALTAKWEHILDKWYSEYNSFDSNLIYSYRASGTGSAHFSQMIHAKTAEIGCGYARLRDAKNQVLEKFVCNYGPAGNFENLPIYASGAACSQCGKFICETVSGLCVNGFPALPVTKDPGIEEQPSSSDSQHSAFWLIDYFPLLIIVLVICVLLCIAALFLLSEARREQDGSSEDNRKECEKASTGEAGKRCETDNGSQSSCYTESDKNYCTKYNCPAMQPSDTQNSSTTQLCGACSPATQNYQCSQCYAASYQPSVSVTYCQRYQ